MPAGSSRLQKDWSATPEGDTVYRTAESLRRWFGGRQITATRSAPGVVALDRLVGSHIDAVESHGKHLLVRTSAALVLHTHMRMTGSWHVYPTGERWRKPARQARVVLEAGARLAVCFNAPVVELLTAREEDTHPVLRRLGPDVLGADALDPATVVARARHRDRLGHSPTIGELLLDQQVVAGIGNIYRCESLFVERTHPAIPVADIDDDHLLRLVSTAARLMQANAFAGSTIARRFTGPEPTVRPEPTVGPDPAVGPEPTVRPDPAVGPDPAVRPGQPWVYGRAGRPCRRCGTLIRRAEHGRQARSVYWCPHCQPNG